MTNVDRIRNAVPLATRHAHQNSPTPGDAMTLRDLFVDMNSYFASVEQQVRPELRGKPVAVIPMLADTTCCIAASYEAKAFGVTTGTPVRDARRLCPQLRLVESRPEVYIRMHHRIVAAVDSVLPVQAVLSIDEMVCRLLGAEREPEAARELALQVKQAIASQVGSELRCSIGIGPNRMLAKLASDLQKPNGLTILPQADLQQRLQHLSLKDFPGIGSRMEARLTHAGITTVPQLYQCSRQDLRRIWGSRLIGDTWFGRLRGEDLPDPPTHRGSIGHSQVLAPADRHPAAAEAIFTRLAHQAAARMRKVGDRARGVQVHVTFFSPNVSWSERQSFAPCDDTLTLLQVARKLWRRQPPGTPGKVGIVFDQLMRGTECTPSLFPEDHSREKLAHAMDDINQRFGQHAVYFGGMHHAKGPRPLRIAFTRIPELDEGSEDAESQERRAESRCSR